MNNINITEIKKACLDHDNLKFVKTKPEIDKLLEVERQAWLKAGMSDADISCMHYGNGDKKSVYSGDYDVWRREISHSRNDHKYIGKRVSTDEPIADGISVGDTLRDLYAGMNSIDLKIDFERAFKKLTDIQRYSFVEVCLKERTNADVAKERGKHISTIHEAVKSARIILQKYF